MNTTQRRLVALFGLALGSSLSACAGDDLTATMAPQPAPPNYRQLTQVYFATALAKLPLTGATIGAIRPAIAPQPAEWVACVKLAGGEYYAVFYAEGKVVDARIALTIDRCAVADGYAPLSPPEKPKPAIKPGKGKKDTKD